jgi:heme-degrading monooxygenase HmoA
VIARIWHGYTAPVNADEYERLLKQEVFAGIAAKNVKGYHGIQLLRRALAEEVEFITIMWFDAMESVREFAGADYEVAYVPEKARALLSRFDSRSQHYELRETREYH